KSFEPDYLEHIRYYCLVMSEKYIRNHFNEIKSNANIIEARIDDEYCTIENVLRDNAYVLEQCKAHNAEYILIDDKYEVDIEL
ncbi:MAG: adenylate kinase, partial [Oscillospiraceae bacterium]